MVRWQRGSAVLYRRKGVCGGDDGGGEISVVMVAEWRVRRGDREGLDFEASYAPEELNEFVSVLKKLLQGFSEIK